MTVRIQPPAPISPIFTEDSAPSLSTFGFINFADVDLQDTHTVGAFLQSAVFSGGPALSIFPATALTATLVDFATGDGHGQYRCDFALDNNAVQFLGQGQTLTLTYRTTVTDTSPFAGTHFTTGQNVVITINGQNDAPVIQGPSTINLGPIQPPIGPTQPPIGTPGQTTFELANNLSFSDADITDLHGVSWSFNAGLSDGGAPLGFFTASLLNDTSFGTGGLVHWSYQVDPALVNALPAGTVRHETFDVLINDAFGGIAVEHITVTINGSATPPPPPSVSFVTLDYPGVGYTLANDINDYGEVVGQTGAVAGSSYTGFDFAGGHFTPIAVTGATNTSANTVNDNGLVGGWYEPSGSTPRYGFTDLNGTYTPGISLLPNISTTVDGINNGGVFVGSLYHGGTSFSGYINNGGAVTQLDVSGAATTSANGINDGGDVVGSYNNAHGFLYQNGIYTTIDAPLGVNGTIAADINDSGQIVGWYTDAGNKAHGFVDIAGVFTTIDDPLGVNGTYVRGINDMGQIVGWYTDAGNVNHGFIANIADGTVAMGFPSNDTLNGTPANDLISDSRARHNVLRARQRRHRRRPWH